MTEFDPMNAEDPRFIATMDMIRRTGARSFQIRYSDDEQPIIWMTVGEWLWKDGRPVAEGGEPRYEAAAALSPLGACVRLLEQIMDGGMCEHCGKMTSVEVNFTAHTFAEEHICWYVYDPELNVFRRSCEGD